VRCGDAEALIVDQNGPPQKALHNLGIFKILYHDEEELLGFDLAGAFDTPWRRSGLG